MLGRPSTRCSGSGSFLEWAARIPWQRGQTPLARIPQYEDAAMQLYFENPDYTAFLRTAGFGYGRAFSLLPRHARAVGVEFGLTGIRAPISDGYQAMVKTGRKNQHLLIGPWSHNNFECSLGDVNFGNEGGTIGGYDDFLNLELAWFDRWMKDNRALRWRTVPSVCDGRRQRRRGAGGRLNHGGRWQSGEAWPPQERPADAILSARAGGPVPGETCGSAILPDLSLRSREHGFQQRPLHYRLRAGRQFGISRYGTRDQIELETLPGHGIPGRPIAERPDVLVYQTAPLEDVSLAGT